MSKEEIKNAAAYKQDTIARFLSLAKKEIYPVSKSLIKFLERKKRELQKLWE